MRKCQRQDKGEIVVGGPKIYGEDYMLTAQATGQIWSLDSSPVPAPQQGSFLSKPRAICQGQQSISSFALVPFSQVSSPSWANLSGPLSEEHRNEGKGAGGERELD